MPPDGHTVPVKYRDNGLPPPPGQPPVDTSGGVIVEMCSRCFTLVPAERISSHMDGHPQRPDVPPPPEPEVNPLA